MDHEPAERRKSIKLLLVEDDEDDYVITRNLVARIVRPQIVLEWVRSYDDALKALTRNHHQLALVDFRLGARTGLELMRAACVNGCRAPFIILTSQDDHSIDIEAMKAGATDYLIKGEITPSGLERAIRYALERYRLLEELRHLSLVDELTALHNRRGFMTLAEQEFKLAQRSERNIFLFFIDLDGMKRVNDSFGHLEGDRALTDAAQILRKTFRDSDILARLGGDEFAVLALETSLDKPEVVLARLQQQLDAVNAVPNRKYRLEMSVGTVRFDPKRHGSLEDMMAQADQEMYRAKQQRRA